MSIGANKTVNLIITNKVIKIYIGRIVKMINTTRLRCTIGWLGIALPWLVVLLRWTFPPSISSTYYTWEAGAVFMIILGSASLLLFTYKGYNTFDDIINTITGIFGLMICLFPCWNSQFDLVGTFQIPVGISSTLHNISAFGFFGCLAYNSIFQFTKHGVGEMTANKKKRNVIYIICGIGMIASFTILLFPSFPNRVWIIETIALFFFGISWLTKADYYPWLFADKKK